jgi:hypothetical protein
MELNIDDKTVSVLSIQTIARVGRRNEHVCPAPPHKSGRSRFVREVEVDKWVDEDFGFQTGQTEL